MEITNGFVQIYIIVILINNSTSANINYGYLCLETAKKFVNNDTKCKFTEDQTASFFKDDKSSCDNKCEFTRINITQEMKDLTFDFAFDAINTSIHVCTNPNFLKGVININCSLWLQDDYRYWETGTCTLSNADCVRINTICICECQPGFFVLNGKDCVNAKVMVNESCASDKQCKGTPFARNCSGGLCSCQDGYILINDTCYPRDLILNQPCTYDNQCFGSPNAGCLGEKCVCREGYSARDSSVCVQIDEFKEYRADDNNKSLLGAIIGGPFVGAIIVIGSVFLLYKRFRSNNTIRKETAIHFANSDTNRVSDHITPLRENKQKNVAANSAHNHSGEAVEYSHIYDETREALTQDDVYHYLNEEKEQQLDDGNYDHACAAVCHVADLNEYSVISDAKNNTTVSPTVEIDEYFVLEQSVNKDG